MTRMPWVFGIAVQGLIGLILNATLPLSAVAKDAAWPSQEPTPNIRRMAEWVTRSQDNGGRPFVIIDKQNAKVFVYDTTGHLLGSAWALVGLANGDDSAPGIGTMPLAAITPDMRTTPAGRFVAKLGHDLGSQDVLWVDYADAISLHRVINTDPAERRLERIVSKNPAEHRISYGCINVPARFFDAVVDPAFKDTSGVVYILPEVKPLLTVFPNYRDGDDLPLQAAAGGVAKSVAYEADASSVENHDLPGVVHRPGL
jgi:hypothetical protein